MRLQNIGELDPPCILPLQVQGLLSQLVMMKMVHSYRSRLSP